MIYNESLRTYFENCLLPQFVSQTLDALRHKSWKETNFKVSAQRFNVSIYTYIG